MKTVLPPRFCRTVHALALQTLALLVWSCSNSHSPQAGDTATSWLRSCVDDGDCTGAGRCIAHVCTLPCAGTSDACSELAAEARCLAEAHGEGSACDVVCDRSADCAMLGAGYACQDARCRVSSAVQLASRTLALEGTGDAPETWQPTFPLVAWAGDRWRIAHVSWRLVQNYGGSSVRLISEVYADGAVAAQAAPSMGEPPAAPARPRPSAMAHDGTLVVELAGPPAPLDLTPIQYRFVLPESERRPELSYARADLVPLPEGHDWVVLSQDDAGSLSLGRYDPHEERWVIQERELSISLTASERARVAIVGDDVLVLRGHDTEPAFVGRVVGFAAPAAESFEPDRPWHEADARSFRTSDGEGYFSWHVTEGGWLLPEWREWTSTGPQTSEAVRPPVFSQRPPGFRVRGDGSVESAVQFRLSTNNLADLQGSAGLPERDAIAFCHAEINDPDDTGVRRTSLLFSVFGATGRIIAGPTPLISSTNALRGCQLTWSGSALLATWLEEDESGTGRLYARILETP